MKQPHIEEAFRRILSRRRRNVPEPCPDANEFAAFLEERLSSEEKIRFEEHAADCAACREALALSLQLDAAEERISAPAVSAPRAFTYRTSPIRLVFAAAVVVVVGALLFQTTRQSQPTLQKTQISDERAPRDVSGGTGAALSSRESPSPSAAAPAYPVGALTGNPSGELALARRDRIASKPQPVTPPGPEPGQAVPETAQLSRPQAPVSADTLKFATAESVSAELQKKALSVAENRNSKTDIAVNRPEEVKAKAEAVNAPAGQNFQQASPANVQNIQLNQQAAADQAVANRVQMATIAGGRGGAVDLQTVEEKKQQAESVRQAQISQESMPAKTGAVAGGKQMLAMRSMMADAKGNSAMTALAEARPLLAKDQARDKAKKIGERQFYRTANFWVDAECVAHPDVPVREINRDAGEFADILGKETALALRALDAPILVYWNGANYLIR